MDFIHFFSFLLLGDYVLATNFQYFYIMKVEEELTFMKKNKIKALSIIFLGLAVLTMISWTITFVLEIDLFSIVTNSAFLTILFIPFVIVIYVAGAVGVIGVSTYLGIAIMVLNIIKLTSEITRKKQNTLPYILALYKNNAATRVRVFPLENHRFRNYKLLS